MYHREYMIYDPRRPTVEAELQITSLEGLFRGQNGQGLRRGDLKLEAVALNEEEADALQTCRSARRPCALSTSSTISRIARSPGAGSSAGRIVSA